MSRPGFAAASVHYWPTRLPGLEVLPSPGFGAGRCALSARCFSVFLLSWRGWWVLASSWAFGVPLFAGGSIPYLGSPVSRSLAGIYSAAPLLAGGVDLIVGWALNLSTTRASCAWCLGVFPSSCVLGVLSFIGGPVRYLSSCWCLGFLRDILCCSFTGCRCLAPAPGAAALAGLLSFLVFFGVPLFASRTWVPAGFLVCCRVYSALLLCWLPLFGAYSRRCGSCRPPEFRFGLRSLWCCCFFLDLGRLLRFGPGCLLGSCWFSHHGLEVLTLFWVWRANLASSALLAASVPYVLGVSVCFRVLGVPFFAGCRCSAPAPGAAALAGLLSFASVYGRFGVFPSSWIWGALCALLAPSVCFVLGVF